MILKTISFLLLIFTANISFTQDAYATNKEGVADAGSSVTTQFNHKIIVIIPEYHIRRRLPDPVRRKISDPAGETEIIKRLSDKGFKLVDQSQVSKIRYNDQVKSAINGDTDLASKIGLDHGAEIIIIGEAFSESAGHVLGDFISCRARVEARAIRTDTGEIIAVNGTYGTGLDITDAIAGKKALQKAGEELASYFIEQFHAKLNNNTNSKTVEIVITGLDYKQFINFKKILLESLSIITAIHQRSFTTGRAVIEIKITGNAQDLSETLILKDFKEFNVDVTDITENRLTISVNN